jgi:hypothetical protein
VKLFVLCAANTTLCHAICLSNILASTIKLCKSQATANDICSTFVTYRTGPSDKKCTIAYKILKVIITCTSSGLARYGILHMKSMLLKASKQKSLILRPAWCKTNASAQWMALGMLGNPAIDTSCIRQGTLQELNDLIITLEHGNSHHLSRKCRLVATTGLPYQVRLSVRHRVSLHAETCSNFIGATPESPTT